MGQLTVERDWLKKMLNDSLQARREMVDPLYAQLSVQRQCQLLGLNLPNLYKLAVGKKAKNFYSSWAMT
jgi:hypothetical protein